MLLHIHLSGNQHQQVRGALCFFLLLLQTVTVQAQNNYTYGDLQPCGLDTVAISNLGPTDDLEPCIIAQVYPFQTMGLDESQASIISMVQVTPSNCNNHRDGSVTGARMLNADNESRGVAIGFNQDHFVQFHFVSVVAGNPAFLSEGEYDRRHDQILRSMITTLEAPYIVGSCSFASAVEKGPADDLKAILLAQVGPPGFYLPYNPYLFGFHICSDTYPLPNVQSLGFLAKEVQGGAPSIPVRVIYRTKSEFFYSTCRSAIDRLRQDGFTDLVEIIYDHAADHDNDGHINQFDDDFLISLADQACPPGSDPDFHPALFVCTLTEHDTIVKRWIENGCKPISTWVTAATWGWADNNPDVVPYYQGGGQWHAAFDYSDRYFDSGLDVLLHNEKQFMYMGDYDQVVSYAIPILYAQHLQAAYRVQDNPRPLEDFATDEGREILRRAMVVLNVDSIFGPIAFDDNQRNNGRGAAGTQWLPLNPDDSFVNALVSPFLQAQANTVIPASSALPCQAGQFVNDTSRVQQGSVLASGCEACLVDFFSQSESQDLECKPCPAGSTTEGRTGQTFCITEEDNLLSRAILAFGYLAVTITWTLSISFLTWLYLHRKDPIVRVSQIEFMALICIGAMISSSTIIALTFQAGTDEDTTQATAGCTAAPFMYAIGWVLQYSSLSAKTFRLYKVVAHQKKMQRVIVPFFHMFRIIIFALAVDLIVIISWTATNPLVYERSEPVQKVDNEAGVITLSSVGRCVIADEGTSIWVFVGPLLGFHLLLMVVTNILLLQVRHVTDRYQESKYVAFASMLMFEMLIVGLPVMIAVNDSPTATFIVLAGVIALDDIGILCFIFVPKIRFQMKGLEEGVGFGESIMKDTLKRASTRESFRSASFSQSDMPLSPPMLTNPFESSLVNSSPFESYCGSVIEESIDEETPEELRLCGQSDEGSLNPDHLYKKDDDVDSKTGAIREVREKTSIDTYLANRIQIGSFCKRENEEASKQAPPSPESPTTASSSTDDERTKVRSNKSVSWWKGADESSPSFQMSSLGATTSSVSVDEQVAKEADGDVSDAIENDVTPAAEEAMPESGDAEADSSPAVEEHAESLKADVIKSADAFFGRDTPDTEDNSSSCTNEKLNSTGETIMAMTLNESSPHDIHPTAADT